MIQQRFPTREALEKHQLLQLRELVDVISETNHFYREKLDCSGFQSGADVIDLDTFSKKFPITTKQELVEDQNKYVPFGSNLSYPIEEYTRFHQTSGTTGSALRWPDTPKSWQWMLENWKHVYWAAEVGTHDRIAFAFSFGPFLGFWTAFEAGTQIGAMCLPCGGMSTLSRLKLIIDNQVTVLCCTPTYALRLAEVAKLEQIDLSKSAIQKIIVAGEPGGSVPAVRELIQKVWVNAHVYDHHGMTEVGPVSYQHRDESEDLRIIESSYLVEVIDPNEDKPVDFGEMGELVLTTLGRLGTPLLRYRTGDYVKAVRPRSDDSDQHVILKGGILGRTDDMVVIRGVNIFPSAVDAIIRGYEGVVEYQVVVDQSNPLPQLSITIEPNVDLENPAALVNEIKNHFLQAFTLRVEVLLAEVESLPRYEMKAKRWVTQS